MVNDVCRQVGVHPSDKGGSRLGDEGHISLIKSPLPYSKWMRNAAELMVETVAARGSCVRTRPSSARRVPRTAPCPRIVQRMVVGVGDTAVSVGGHRIARIRRVARIRSLFDRRELSVFGAPVSSVKGAVSTLRLNDTAKSFFQSVSVAVREARGNAARAALKDRERERGLGKIFILRNQCPPRSQF
jgi:hypothetical protein